MRRGTCTNCGDNDVLVNVVTRQSVILGELCAECFDEVDHDSDGSELATGAHNAGGGDRIIRSTRGLS